MNTLLFYKNPVPLNREAHRNVRFKPLADGYSYAAMANSVPIALVEFPNACVEYPVVFILNDNGDGTPVALTGLRNNENVFVAVDNNWDGDYVPAFVRRYPFALYEEPGTNNMYVLVDEEAAGFNAADGEPLFKEDGSESDLLAHILKFVDYFKGEGPRARDFVALLKKHELLVSQTINVQAPGGGTLAMEGFHVVDEEKLAKLNDTTLLELARSGDLTRIYAHLLSLNNLPKLLRRLGPRLEAERAEKTA